jgi:hypothetical protein
MSWDEEAMASRTEDERRAIALSSGLGRTALVFDNNDVVALLRTAIEREGSQIAFAKHYDINRTHLSMVLSGKRPVGAAVAAALGLRKMYVVE